LGFASKRSLGGSLNEGYTSIVISIAGANCGALPAFGGAGVHPNDYHRRHSRSGERCFGRSGAECNGDVKERGYRRSAHVGNGYIRRLSLSAAQARQLYDFGPVNRAEIEPAELRGARV